MNDRNKFDHLSERELLSEISYLRQTLAPNIREEKKVQTKLEDIDKLLIDTECG